jgi:hypothetical protein
MSKSVPAARQGIHSRPCHRERGLCAGVPNSDEPPSNARPFHVPKAAEVSSKSVSRESPRSPFRKASGWPSSQKRRHPFVPVARAIIARTYGAFGEGLRRRKRKVAANPPTIWAAMNSGTSTGRIPAKVLESERAIVTAGLANEVDAVNQYAAVMYAATANGTADARCREHPKMTNSRPKVATNSLRASDQPGRARSDIETTESPNIR